MARLSESKSPTPRIPVAPRIKHVQAAADVGQPDAALSGSGPTDARAVVPDRQGQRALAGTRFDPDSDAARLRVGAVLDRVLDQRLKKEARHLRGSGRRVRLDVDPDAVAKPQALDIEVLVQEREVALERDELRRFGEQAGAQQVPQAHNHSPGPARLASDQRQERVQGVEEEVRLELRLQSRELCLEEGAAKRLACGQPPEAQAVPAPDEKEFKSFHTYREPAAPAPPTGLYLDPNLIYQPVLQDQGAPPLVQRRLPGDPEGRNQADDEQQLQAEAQVLPPRDDVAPPRIRGSRFDLWVMRTNPISKQRGKTRKRSKTQDSFAASLPSLTAGGRWEIQRLSSGQEFPQSVAMAYPDPESRVPSPESRVPSSEFRQKIIPAFTGTKVNRDPPLLMLLENRSPLVETLV